MTITVLGSDLGKNSCSVAGFDETGRVILRRKLNRDGVVRLAAKLPACVMTMEACCGPHHLGRVLRDQGHEVRLMSSEYVQPYVKAQIEVRLAELLDDAGERPPTLSARTRLLSARRSGGSTPHHNPGIRRLLVD